MKIIRLGVEKVVICTEAVENENFIKEAVAAVG